MSNRLVLLLLTSLVLLASCSKSVTTLPTIGPAKSHLSVEEIDFGYLHGKARLVLKDGTKEREVKATIRVRKDSVIWMSLGVMGVPGGRALINKDSITIVSNVDKEYYVFDYKELSKRFNFEVNYEVIQAAALGNLIKPRSADDVVAQQSSMFALQQSMANVNINNYVNAATMKIERVEMKERESENALTIQYSNFQPVGDKIFPYNGVIAIFYKTVSGLLNTTIIFEYSKAEVGDKELKFPFNIPKRYERR